MNDFVINRVENTLGKGEKLVTKVCPFPKTS